NIQTSTVRTVTVDNTAPVAVMGDPGTPLTGTVTLTGTSSDSLSGVDTITFQYRLAGQSSWTSTPAAWNTALGQDGSYDLRVIVTDHAGNSSTSAIVASRIVDN